MELNNETIGNVELIYSFYNGNDSYSDGSVEADLLEYVKYNKNYDEIIAKDQRFAVLYHLAKDRENIMSPIVLSKDDSVLEIGSGCGAITTALLKRAGSVDCIELSRRRSLINAYKNINSDNLKIYVGNFQDIRLEKKYDVITLIGVLEYSPLYIGGPTPFMSMLKKIKSMLKENGRVIIAIENRLGLKYFAGAEEDHLGKEFIGIEGYAENSTVKTFSRNELIKLFNNSGFRDINFYYPFPDYKFPKVIYGENREPSKDEISTIYSNYSSDKFCAFDELKAWYSLVDTDDWKFFANSFLIEIKTEEN